MPSKKNWKGINIDWTALLGYDNTEIIPVCLTQRQIAVLKACLIPAYWSTRWLNLIVSADVLEEFVADIDNQLSGNDCGAEIMEFRDNPVDSCEVQYSTDGGLTWDTMFRKDNCLPATSSTDITNTYTDITNVSTNNTTYAGDILNNAPDWVWVDSDSDKALCWAIDFYVDFVCDFAVTQIQSGNVTRREDNDWLDDLADGIAGAVIAALVFFSSNPITLPAAAVGAIGWASVLLVEEVWDWLVGKDWEDFEDDDAKHDVKCIMYHAMKGQTPDFNVWRDSLEDFEILGEAQKSIGGMVHEMNQSVDVFINYMILMEELNDVLAILPECDCPDRWEHEWDFLNFDREAWYIGGSPPYYGSFVDNLGFDAELNGESPESNIIWKVILSESVPRCDRWAFTYTGVKGTFDSNVTAMEMTNSPQGSDIQTQGWFLTGTHEWFNYFTLDTIVNPTLFIRSCWTDGAFKGSVYVSNIKMGGEGPDPFAGRITS